MGACWSAVLDLFNWRRLRTCERPDGRFGTSILRQVGLYTPKPLLLREHWLRCITYRIHEQSVDSMWSPTSKGSAPTPITLDSLGMKLKCADLNPLRASSTDWLGHRIHLPADCPVSVELVYRAVQCSFHEMCNLGQLCRYTGVDGPILKFQS